MVEKRKIAIIGGGVGAMSAAFTLTETMNARERFDITIYQQGWRLGGKGASGRNSDPANGLCRRIEEHGLHVWGGFYDNAFRVMRSALAESARTAPGWTFPTFDTAFKPQTIFHLADLEDGEWVFNAIRPPSNGAEPGKWGVLIGPGDYLRMLLEQIRMLVGDISRGPGGLRTIPEILGTATFAVLRPLAQQLGAFADAAFPTAAHSAAARALREFAASLQERAMVHAETDPTLREVLVVLDFMCAAAGGIMADRLVTRGWSVVDDEELSAWLRRHGALELTLRSSLVRGVYDYVFGFKHGVTVYGERVIAAGVGLHGLLRMVLTYKGAVFWKMQAGMGDTIFTPLYLALKARGVKFEFFQRATAMHLDPSEKAIEGIEMVRQADLSVDEYAPLILVPTTTDEGQIEIGCWPNEPLWDQLKLPKGRKTWKGINFENPTDHIEAGRRTLKRGEDFDDVILGVSLGGLMPLTKELAEAHQPWADMLTHLHCVETEAMQLWFDRSIEELGWERGSTIVTGFADPFDTYADMTDLLRAEQWPSGQEPKALGYFCAPLNDPDIAHMTQAAETRRVGRRAQRWIEEQLPVIFPNTLIEDGQGNTSFDWSVLHDPDNREGPERLKAQYHRANVLGSELYVTCGPGTTRFRLRAGDTGFSNLAIAGDWVKTALSAGCVEAATMAGMGAAKAISGDPIEIIGEMPPPTIAEAKPPAPSTLQAMRAQDASFPWSFNSGVLTTAGTAVVLWVPRGTAAALLPEGLKPIPQPGMGEHHPVVLLLGTQANVGARFFPLGLHYDETVLAVPFVSLNQPAKPVAGPYIFMPKLWLDQLFPTVLGIAAYGYSKELARLEAGATRYTIRGLRHGQPILDATLAPMEDETGLEGGAMPADVQSIFQQPIISRTLWGSWLTSFYDFNMAEASLRPSRIALKLSAPILPGAGLPTIVVPPLLPGEWAPPDDAPPVVPRGAFRLRTLATITSPMQSGALNRLVARD